MTNNKLCSLIQNTKERSECLSTFKEMSRKNGNITHNIIKLLKYIILNPCSWKEIEATLTSKTRRPPINTITNTNTKKPENKLVFVISTENSLKGKIKMEDHKDLLWEESIKTNKSKPISVIII